MPSLILDLVVDRVDLVDEGANSEAFIKLYKRKENETTMSVEEILAKMKPEHAEVIREEIAKAKGEVPEAIATELAKAKQDYTELLAEHEVAKAATVVEPDFEEVLKNADPVVQEVFKSLNAQKQAAEEATRQLLEKTKHEEAVAKAKELKALPVEEDKLVQVIKSASPEVVEVLKAAATALDNSEIFEEVGKSKPAGASDANTAWAKIEKKAGEIEARDSVTKAKAISIAIKENPDLYREYLDGGAN